MNDLEFMREALKEAMAAYDNGEYPIGAVIVYQNEIVARGANAEDSDLDPTAHAEIVAIRRHAKRYTLRNYEAASSTQQSIHARCARVPSLPRRLRRWFMAEEHFHFSEK